MTVNGPRHTYECLFERLIRAKIKVESLRRKHDDRCMIELDPDYYGECTCGAAEHNAPLDAVMEELEL